MAEAPIELFKAIAHPLRFQILAALAGTERNVGQIEEATGIGQPTLSQQLSVLRGAGLVDTRREAKLVFYRIAPGALGEAIAALAALVPEAPGPGPGTEAGHKRLTGAAVFARMA